MSGITSFSNEPTVVPAMCIDEWLHGENNPITCVIECEPPDDKNSQLSFLVRYKCAVSNIVDYLNQLGNEIMYDLRPFLVGEAEDLDVMEKLPSIISNFKVKCQVIDGQLFILDISTLEPYGHGRAAIQNEVCRWSNNHDKTYFSHNGDTNYPKEDGSGSYAPDCVIFVGPRYTNSNASMKVVVIEVEVSNRNPKGLRRDYATYFDEDSMICVIGIKLFGKKSVPGRRAAAVMWTRGNDGTITPTAALDIGILPLTHTVKNGFAAEGVGLLPPIQVDSWVRFEPLPDAVMNVSGTANEILLHASSWVLHHEPCDLYPNQVPPRLVINAGALVTKLEPRGDKPVSAEDIGSLTINLNAVFQKVFLSARPYIEQERAVGQA